MRVLKILTCCFIFTVIISSQIFGQVRLYNKSQSWSDGGGGGWQGPNGDSWSPQPQKFDFGRDVLLPALPGLIEGFTRPQPQQYNFQRPQYQQPQYQQPQPQYYTQPRYTPQPTYTPATVVKPAPVPVAPKNQIVTIKKKPVVSVVKNTVAFQLGPTLAETDARQEVEATKAERLLSSATTQELERNIPTTDPNRNAIINDWSEVIRRGSTKSDVDSFLVKYGSSGSLPKDALENLGMQSQLAGYREGLQSGVWGPTQKDAALISLQKSFDGYSKGKNATAMASIQQNLTNMQNYNTLGKLAVVSQHSDNPFAILLQGSNTMQMPPMFVSELTGYPVITVDPVADQVLGNDTAPPSRATILIENPDSNDQTVKYMLDKYSYTMEAGHQQELDRAYVITFDPGNGVKQKSYTLGDGYYAWSSDPKTGWDLLKKSVKVEIDNSRYSGKFSYLLNGERQQVGPGEIAEHSSDLPLEVTFHGGRDGTEHRKMLKPGRYIVGLDPSKGTLDLFSAKSVEEAEQKEPPYQASTTIGGNNATQAQRVQALLGQLKPVNGASVSQPDTPKGVSPLGRPIAPAASVEDLLKSIKQPAKDPFQ